MEWFVIPLLFLFCAYPWEGSGRAIAWQGGQQWEEGKTAVKKGFLIYKLNR